MNKFDVVFALSQVREAKAVWAQRITEFNSGVDAVMGRLLHEAAANRMSPEEVAKAAGLTVKRVRGAMRNAGLNPRDGKTLLSQKAAEALANNASLLGIEPSEMDLMSPLAYLPMGEELRKRLAVQATAQVHSVDEGVFGNKCNVCRLNDTWMDDHCTNSRCASNMEDRLYQAIVSEYEGMGEAWTTDSSGDTLARAAARVAVREMGA